MRIVITGANRGIGLELAAQFLARGDEVEAAVRRPEEATALRALGGALRVHACDVADTASVEAFARALGDAPIDVLINNAGVMGKMQALADLDMVDVMRTLETNTLGVLRVTGRLLPNLRRGAAKKIVSISSGMGSIGDNTSGGAYGYRMSKAALNMACRSMAVDLKKDGIIAVVMNPGWVQTDMGGSGAPTAVGDSARGIIARIDGLEMKDSGTFLDFRGRTWEW